MSCSKCHRDDRTTRGGSSICGRCWKEIRQTTHYDILKSRQVCHPHCAVQQLQEKQDAYDRMFAMYWKEKQKVEDLENHLVEMGERLDDCPL